MGSISTNRRLAILTAATLLAFVATAFISAQTAAAKPQMTVYKSSTCGCCSNWVAHMKANGFEVKSVDVDDIDKVKQEHGVPSAAASCHTALVNGYIVEGHVPADAVLKVLKEKPAIAGIAVPGMPMGSPGMEIPGGQKEAFNIVAFDKAGKTSIYQKR